MSSDSAITVPFQEAVVMSSSNAGPTAASPASPAQGVHLPRLGRPAGAAVAPGHDAQLGGRAAALGAVDGVGGMGPRVGDVLRPLLVDALVAPAGATEVCFGAASMQRGDGVPPGIADVAPQ